MTEGRPAVEVLHHMSKPLVIVESPAKARTIAGFLGSGYVVEASIGHIRDLPRGADEVPAALKGEPWARLGVNVDSDFKPLYVVARTRSRCHQAEGAAQGRRRALSRHRRGPRGGVHRLAPARGAVAPKRCRCGAWCSTRSPPAPSRPPSPTPATSTSSWSTPRRPGASSTASTATRCRPSCGARCCPGSRRGGCRAWPAASSSSGSGSGCGSAPPPTGTSKASSPKPRPNGTVGRFGATLVSVDGARLATGKDFDETGPALPPRATSSSSTTTGPAALAERLAGRRIHACDRSRRSPTGAARTRRS